jgi:hypothetical protein
MNVCLCVYDQTLLCFSFFNDLFQILKVQNEQKDDHQVRDKNNTTQLFSLTNKLHRQRLNRFNCKPFRN